MSVTSIPRLPNDEVGVKLKKLSWFMLSNEGHPMLQCSCGTRALMSLHSVKKDGTVKPSIVCPENCGMHIWGRLEDWEGGDLEPQK